MTGVEPEQMSHSGDDAVRPDKVAEQLLEEVLQFDDERGHLANATGDELRDALRLAADRIRVREGYRPKGPWMLGIRRLVAEVWHLVDQGRLNARSPVGDAVLDLRDMVDLGWMPNVEEERARFRGDDPSGRNATQR